MLAQPSSDPVLIKDSRRSSASWRFVSRRRLRNCRARRGKRRRPRRHCETLRQRARDALVRRGGPREGARARAAPRRAPVKSTASRDCRLAPSGHPSAVGSLRRGAAGLDDAHGGRASFVHRVRTRLEVFGCCVVLPALPSGLTKSEAGERIARGVERLAGQLPPLSGLTVIGGETFAGVCRVLKATRLRVEGEFLHGVPFPAWSPASGREPSALPSPAPSASRTGCSSISASCYWQDALRAAISGADVIIVDLFYPRE